MIQLHGSSYRCLKHFYLEHVTKHLCHLFLWLVSYVMMKGARKSLLEDRIICNDLLGWYAYNLVV